MKQFCRLLSGLFTLGLVASIASAAFADGLYVYPLKGQSAQQEQTDRYTCHEWAIAQTGFNPSTAPQPSGARGAFKGVLGGLLVGGIVAATGGAAAAIAIGAGAGGLIGGIIGSDKQAKISAQYNSYLQAAKTCMAAKGYEVST